jgi:hypothetical protein
MPRWRRSASLLGTLLTLGCGRPDPTCDTPADGLPVRYVGQAYGYGDIGVGWNEDTQQHRVTVGMVAPDSVVVVALTGEGTCKDGVLRARLGGGRDAESGLRVLGGGLVVLFDHTPLPSVAGLWDVHVVFPHEDHEGAEGRRFRGMLESIDPSKIPDGARNEGGDMEGPAGDDPEIQAP